MSIKKHLSFKSLRQYVSKVFKAIPDFRDSKCTDISLHDGLMSGFACMYFQDPSLNQFQKRLQDAKHQDNLSQLFDIQKIPSNNRMTEIVDEVDSEEFSVIFRDFFARLQRGKQLEKFKFLPKSYLLSIDGKKYHSSKNIKCDYCLKSEHRNGNTFYSHGVLLPAIVKPGMQQVLPFMPEEISNTDGKTKQDCEIKAAKRFLKNLKVEYPKLKTTLLGDGLFSTNPFIKEALKYKHDFIFVAKPGDHAYLFNYIKHSKYINEYTQHQEKDDTYYRYEWENKVRLFGFAEAINVNFFKIIKYSINKDGTEKILYFNTWVTNLQIDKNNVVDLVLAGRARWKSENECFNTLTNQGYHIEHNYGHGKKNACFNYFLFSLLSFIFHQIFELTDKLYISCRKKFGSKKSLWETLRSYIRIIIFISWEELLNFSLCPESFHIIVCPQAP